MPVAGPHLPPRTSALASFVLLFASACISLLGPPAVDAETPSRDAIIDGMIAVEKLRDADRQAEGMEVAEAFEQRYPRTLFAERLDRRITKESVLESLWGEAPDRQRLQAELDRIARHTRRPEKLRRVFALLDDDADRIAAVLVRPHWVDQRLRQRFEGASLDEKTGLSLDAWLERQHTKGTIEPPSITGLRLPKVIGSGTDQPDSWTLELPRGPQAKKGQSAIWTGAELIVWGGSTAGMAQDGLWTNAGFAYDPVSDTWTPLRLDASTPEPRAYHTAVWTGSKMIVWGGESWDAEAEPPYYVALGSGGVYDPVEDRWTATPSDGAPSPRQDHAAVWTGTEMLVWGGMVPGTGGEEPPPEVPSYTVLSDGSRFDPAFGGWTAMGGTPPSARGRVGMAWTGDTFYVVGGYDGTDWIEPTEDSTTFSSYDPADDSWNTALPQPSTGGPGGPSFEAPIALWTGQSLWVAQPASGRLVTNWDGSAWTQPSPPPATGDRRYESMVWTGRRLVIWGGLSGMPMNTSLHDDGLIYDTASNLWTTIPSQAADPPNTDGTPSARFAHIGIWTGAEMIIWGGSTVPGVAGGAGRPANTVSTGGRFTPNWDGENDTGTWTAMPEPPVVPLSGHTLTWTGSEMIAWGGMEADALGTGSIYDPMLDRWSATPTSDDDPNAPAPRRDHSAVWTGSELVVWGGTNGGVPFDTGARYDPVGDSWTTTGGSPPTGRTNHTAVWTGSEMVIWGGDDGTGPLDSGSRYDPELDTWTATGGTPPAARSEHAAAWTGDSMVIFGGLEGCPGSCTASNGAAIYDPSGNSWSATFTATGDVGHRWAHSLVHTGDAVLAWGGAGGFLDTNPCLADGVEIDPVAETATPMATDSAGDGRCSHTAIWNGAEMIVWGGTDRLNTSIDGGVPQEMALASGGRYSPATGMWDRTLQDTSTIPGARSHAAVWTGEEMMIWGGLPEISGALGIYYTDTLPTSSPRLEVDSNDNGIVLLGGDDEIITLDHHLPLAFFDDVEGAELWTTGQTGDAEDAEGVVNPWHVAVASACNPGGDYVSPIRAWRFGAEGTCHYNGTDGSFTLTSTLDFEITAETRLELRYLLGTDPVGNPSEKDGALIQVSNNSGADWVTVAIDQTSQADGVSPEAAPLDDTGTTWRGLSIRLQPFAGLGDNGRLRFVFERNGSLDDGIGFFLDDISIGEPAGDGRLPGGTLVASDGSIARHGVENHDLWDRPRFGWDLEGDGVDDNPDPATPVFVLNESDLATYGLDTPGKYDLELTVTDSGGRSETNTVCLEVVDGEPPTVEVLEPNGGEAWAAGSEQQISWSASDNIGLAGFDLAYYDDEAGTGPTAIACAETLDGESRTCTWTLPEATSTAMRVEITARDQRPEPGGPNTATDTSDSPFYAVQANSDAIRTLVVWHRDRFEALYGTPGTDAVGGQLATFASHPKVDGQVLDLSNVPSLDTLYTTWDGTAWATGTTDDQDADIAAANALAEATRQYLFEQIAQTFRNLEFLVLVGGDGQIPFWRLAEDLPRYPESNYIAELQTFGLLDDASSPEAFCDESESPMMVALCRDRYPADTPYGASATTDVLGSSFTWYMPDLAIGRLVETPEQISGLIDVFVTQDGVTVVDRALTTGYDFLTDGGDAVHSLLQAELDLEKTSLDRLSQAVSLWSDDDLLERLFGVPPTEPANLSFVDGHADHRAEGAAQVGEAGVLTTLEMEAAMVSNRGGVLIGVGCHSGLPMEADGGASDETDPAFLLDLPEILAQRSFPVLIGNGGYGWGLSEGVGLGEQLVLLIADELVRAGQIATGEALRLAKQEYFLRQDRLDAFDHKVLHEAMLFGIPNYEVRLELATPETRSEGSWAAIDAGYERPSRAERDAKRAHGPRVPGRPWLGDPSWNRLALGNGRMLTKSARDPSGSAEGLAPSRAPAASATEGVATLRVLDFAFQAFEAGQDTDMDPGTADWQEAYAQFDWCTDAEGESVLCTGAMDETEVGTFFTLDGLASAESGRPIQPMISFDSRLFGTELHGILVRGGEFLQPAVLNPQDPARCTDELGTVHPCFDPVIGNPETEQDEEEGPAPAPFVNYDTPTPFVNYDTPTPNGFVESGAGGDPIRFDTLNAPMGVAVRRGVREVSPGDRQEIYSQWLYRTREFTNYYSNSSDWAAPEIGAPTADCFAEVPDADCYHSVSGGGALPTLVTFDVPVSDVGDGLFRVFVTHTSDVDEKGQGSWTTMELMPTGPDRFGGTLQVERTTHYLIQAVDWAGNIGTVTTTGNDSDAEGNPIGSTFELPQIFTAVLNDPFFADGFESGDTMGWSATIP